jgi:hypothetical protein
MKEIKLIRKVKKTDTFFPFTISAFLIIFVLLTKGFDINFFVITICVSAILIFLQRYNAVNMTMYEDTIEIDFYLLIKKIDVKYCEIIEIKSLWDTGIGANLRFKVKDKNEIYTFRVKFLDEEFCGFLEEKTGINIK